MVTGPILTEPTEPVATEPAAQQDGIVSQDEDAETYGPFPLTETRARLRHRFPLSARLSVLGLAAALLWWGWPRGDAPRFTLASDPGDEAHSRPTSLAIVNPANVQQGRPPAGDDSAQAAPDATQDAWFANIVVVTPTSPVLTAMPASAPAAAPLRGAAALVGNRPAATADQETAGLEIAPASEISGTGAMPIAVEVPALGAAGEDAVLVQALEVEAKQAPQAGGIQAEIVLLPTATPTPTPLPETTNLLNVPKVEIVPALGLKLTPTPEAPTPAPEPILTPTAIPPTIGPGRLWSTFLPKPPAESDHFWIGNPFADFASNRFPSPNYQFGSTAGNRYRPHHGVDISNPQGTPVQAAVEGEVVHAGPDDPDLLGPYANFYGNAVVIRLDRRLPVAGGELDVYLLYGHLSEVRVAVGQRVHPADVVGLVGMTGIAIGPHLHVEVRLGANTYDHSVNPYLWMEPAPGNGAVAVRVLTKDGRTWAGAKVSIARFEGGQAVWARQIETYLDTEKIGPDPSWGENGAMGDVPAGLYYLIGSVNDESFRAEFPVHPGQTTFIEIRTSR